MLGCWVSALKLGRWVGKFVLEIFFVVWHSEDMFKYTGMKVGSDS